MQYCCMDVTLRDDRGIHATLLEADDEEDCPTWSWKMLGESASWGRIHYGSMVQMIPPPSWQLLWVSTGLTWLDSVEIEASDIFKLFSGGSEERGQVQCRHSEDWCALALLASSLKFNEDQWSCRRNEHPTCPLLSQTLSSCPDSMGLLLPFVQATMMVNGWWIVVLYDACELIWILKHHQRIKFFIIKMVLIAWVFQVLRISRVQFSNLWWFSPRWWVMEFINSAKSLLVAPRWLVMVKDGYLVANSTHDIDARLQRELGKIFQVGSPAMIQHSHHQLQLTMMMVN